MGRARRPRLPVRLPPRRHRRPAPAPAGGKRAPDPSRPPAPAGPLGGGRRAGRSRLGRLPRRAALLDGHVRARRHLRAAAAPGRCRRLRRRTPPAARARVRDRAARPLAAARADPRDRAAVRGRRDRRHSAPRGRRRRAGPEFRPAAAVESASSVPAFAWAAPVPARSDLAAPTALLDVPPEAPPPVEADPAAESGGEVSAYLAEVPSEVAPAKPIENVLDASLAIHRPRRDDGFVYFRVDVRRKGADVLPPVPRNILFVQDASRSISPERLHQCREAFKGVLASGLLPSDRFNVLSFNTANAYAFPDGWRAPTPENVAAATAFVDGLVPEGNTDIYNAMRGILDLPREPGRSTLVFLLSDGVATAGDVRRDSRIIGEFSALNAGGVSVFGLGVSKRSDEYLLSMLSFCNRGGPALVSRDRFEIPKLVARAVEGVGSPVLTDIRFLFDTASGAVVTPRMTENLYLDRPLRLYGRVPAGTKDVTFQARGRNGGKKYDMVFTLRLGDPAPGSGDASIAESWARTRIYDLIASYAGEQDPATLAEMTRLGTAHNLPIPFQDRLGR